MPLKAPLTRALPLDSAGGSAPDPHYRLRARHDPPLFCILWDLCPQFLQIYARIMHAIYLVVDYIAGS